MKPEPGGCRAWSEHWTKSTRPLTSSWEVSGPISPSSDAWIVEISLSPNIKCKWIIIKKTKLLRLKGLVFDSQKLPLFCIQNSKVSFFTTHGISWLILLPLSRSTDCTTKAGSLRTRRRSPWKEAPPISRMKSRLNLVAYTGFWSQFGGPKSLHRLWPEWVLISVSHLSSLACIRRYRGNKRIRNLELRPV